MEIIVMRPSADGLSRARWVFREYGSSRVADGFVLVLDSCGTERRKQPKGRFAAAKAEDRWCSSDERHYYSGKVAPSSIPRDVMLDAIRQTKVFFQVGWGPKSAVGEFNIEPR